MTARGADVQPSGGRQFKLLERIGAGAYGEVYLADLLSGDSGFSRRVAVKVLHPHRHDEQTNRRIRDEARILGHIQHRSVVSVWDLVRLGDRWAVVMDYVVGADLEDVAAALERTGERMPVAAGLRIASEVAGALHAAFHAVDEDGRPLGVVHRDVKPSNVRLTPDGDVKVLDFGLAWGDLMSREASSGNQVVGTRRYMSPERLEGDRGGQEGDVYAVGKMVVELLIGRVLGTSPTGKVEHARWVEECLVEVDQVMGGGPTLSLLRPALSGALETVPARRPSAQELADQLGYLARSVLGDSLQDFAAGFVPRVSDLLGKEVVTATGVLHEASSSSAVVRYTPLPLAMRGELPDPVPVPRRPLVTAPSLESSSGGTVFVARKTSRALPVVLGFVGLMAAAALALSLRPYPAPPLVLDDRPTVESLVVADRSPESQAPVFAPVEVAVVPDAQERVGRVGHPVPSPQRVPSAEPSPVVAEVETEPEVTEPEVIEPEIIEPEPLEDAVVVAPPPPDMAPAVEPDPAPVVAPSYPKVAGTWVGAASGRPLTLRIRGNGPELTGVAEIVQGPTIRTVEIQGTVDEDGLLVLAEFGSGMVFRGSLADGAFSGRWQLKKGGKEFAFRVTRP